MIKIIEPIGFCNGVKSAIKKVEEVREKYPNKKIVFLHPFVHNAKTHKMLLDKVKGEDYDPNKDPKYYFDSYFVFPAHGFIKKEQLLVHYLIANRIDCTCPFLIASKGMMKKDLNNGKTVYFIGKDTHAETLSVLDSDPRIKFISEKKLNNYDFNTFNDDKAVAIYPQSTLSMSVYDKFTEAIKKRDDSAKFKFFPLCHECVDRWKKGLSLDEGEFNSIIVIGDQSSSNAIEFYNMLKQKYEDKRIYLVPDVEKLKEIIDEINFSNNVYLASATSASNETVDAIEKILNKAYNRRFIKAFKRTKKHKP